MKINVKVSFIIPVEVPDDPEYDAEFDIEENHCPGTGFVGVAIEKLTAHHKGKHTCWACSVNGINEII